MPIPDSVTGSSNMSQSRRRSRAARDVPTILSTCVSWLENPLPRPRWSRRRGGKVIYVFVQIQQPSITPRRR
ncbi:unnamed protein product [Mycena citricolor]|uniref:Uncharacterized protein n=1 Tax=Mycena citricolor TaxID=2018698 RepID=A0AAD2JYT3_9AGAR|nr:unnamed protein product [Mycena citricolor]